MHLPRPDWRPDAGDLMGHQMPPGRPDRARLRLLGKYQGLLKKMWTEASFIWRPNCSRRPDGRPNFHILVTSKIWSSIWSPGAIWSPIRSPERLVVDLVVVDAFTGTCICILAHLMSCSEMAANCLKLNPLVSKMKMNPPIWDFSSHSTICPRKQAALMVSLMSISSGFHLSTLNEFIGIV